MNIPPGRFVFAVLLLVSVAADGDDTDRGARSVRDHDGLVLLLHGDQHVGGGGGGTQGAAPNQRVHLGGHRL